MDQTSLIIPAYYPNESFVVMTQACLDSLKYGRPDWVTVVDDGPPHPHFTDTGDMSQICRETNDGFAAAVNEGLRDARGDVLIISNNDIIFTPGWLEAILKPLQQGYDISSIHTSDNGWETHDEITDNNKFGSLWAMTRSAYEKLGPLDERFGKGYFEDLDYWRRARDLGLAIGKNHAGLVEHIGKATFSTMDTRELYMTNLLKYKQKYGDTAYLVEYPKGNVNVHDKWDLVDMDEKTRRQTLAHEIYAGPWQDAWGEL